MDLDGGDFPEKAVSRGGREGILGGSDAAASTSGLDLTLGLRTSRNFDLNMPPDEPDGDGSGTLQPGYTDSHSMDVPFDLHLGGTQRRPDDEIPVSLEAGMPYMAGQSLWQDFLRNFPLKLEKVEQDLLVLKRTRQERKEREMRKRHYESAKDFAKSLDSELSLPKKQKPTTTTVRMIQEEPVDPEAPFTVAMEMLETEMADRDREQRRKIASLEPDFTWVPAFDRGRSNRKRHAPSLLGLSLNALAKHAGAMRSLEHVPDELRHKLSNLICRNGKMDAHFLELLARGSPTEIHVNDCSRLKEDEFTRIFAACDCKNLVVLQLDLCGSCLTDKVLLDTLTLSSEQLLSLATISLVGACRLSDHGLNALAKCTPALQAINLNKCALITSVGISDFVSSFESTLKELYLDECQNVDAMSILPALVKLGRLEVLSVAGIPTVCDDFVIKMITACGRTMKELVFADCVKLTDASLQFVGRTCSQLSALDLSSLHNLTDSTMKYLTNGCRSLTRLKLHCNDFSDEAIAAFLLASGNSLRELSLNNVKKVGVNTAFSLAKSSKELISLDLSWCRKLTDELMVLIVDSCLSLRLLKLFGCTQITDVFLNGHSNFLVKIIGLKMTPITEHLNILESVEAPLRYSTSDLVCKPEAVIQQQSFPKFLSIHTQCDNLQLP